MQTKTKDFQTLPWANLEYMTSEGKCPCCNEKFSADMRPELTGKCHTGPVFTSYWDGWIYIECGECHKPICRVPVDKSLLIQGK